MSDDGPSVGDVQQWFDPAMIVVQAVADGERSACLVGFHCQCSISPTRYAVWISRHNHTFHVAQRAERLSVHALTSDDHDLAAIFGTLTGDEVDKWEALDAAGLELGPAVIEGRVAGMTDDGVCDHVAFVVEPDGGGPIPSGLGPLRISMVLDLDAGHDA